MLPNKLLNRHRHWQKKKKKDIQRPQSATTKRNSSNQTSTQCYSSNNTCKEKQHGFFERHIIISSTCEECKVTSGDPRLVNLDRPLRQLSFLKPLWSRKPYVSWTENESCSILMCSHVGTLCLPLAQKMVFLLTVTSNWCSWDRGTQRFVWFWFFFF